MTRAWMALVCLLWAAPAFAVCSWSGNTGTVASPYAVTDVAACVTDASSMTGAVTIQIPNSSVTWASGLTINLQSGFTNVTALTLRGQNDCTLDGNGRPTACGTNIANGKVYLAPQSGKTLRVAHLAFTGASGFDVNGAGTWRVDHVYFNGVTGILSSRIFWLGKSVGTNLMTGLIDHCAFVNLGWGITPVHYQPTADGGNYEWMVGPELGSANAVYLEDNRFVSLAGGNYISDNNGAARWVFRYNTITDYYIAGHDAQVGGFRGAQKLEAYGNSFISTTTDNCFVVYRTAVQGMFFSNTITGTYGCTGYLAFAIYRADGGSTGWPSSCSATSGNMYLATSTTYPQTCVSGTGCIKTDGSASSPTGYPCRDQPGVSGNDPQVAGGMPYLFWGNTHNGNPVTNTNVSVGAGTSYVANEREYKFQASSVGGAQTTGVGTGTKAQMNALGCTAGVYFWVTDEGSWNTTLSAGTSGLLYKCTATNTWSLYYTPLNYPHPFAGGATPNAPTNVRIR